MENPESEKKNIIKDIKNVFRLRKDLNYTPVKEIIYF